MTNCKPTVTIFHTGGNRRIDVGWVNLWGTHIYCNLPDKVFFKTFIINYCVYFSQKRRVHLTPEQTSDFYAEHYGKLFFPSLVAYMSSGPVIAMVLARENAIAYWRELVGPTNAIKARETHPDW